MNKNLFLDLTIALQAENTLEAQQAILQRTLNDLGFKTFLYALVPMSQEGKAGGFLACTNFREDWLSHYGENDMFANDYAAHHVTTKNTPIIWHDMFGAIDAGNIDRRFKSAADATRDWSYSNGMSLPIRCFGSSTAALTVVADEALSTKEASIELTRAQNQLLTIAHAFHAGVNRNILTQHHFDITAREIEVLKWLSDGLLAKGIAFKTKRSVSTVNKQIISARNRMGSATTVQAVAKAVMLGLI